MLERSGFGDDTPDYVFVPAGGAPPGELALELVFEQGGARVFEAIAD